MVEFIASVLPGAPILSLALAAGAPKRHRQNATILVIDIEKLRPVGEFTADVNRLVEAIKSQPTQSGVDHILLPGERSAATRSSRERDGIPLEENLLDRLTKLDNSV